MYPIAVVVVVRQDAIIAISKTVAAAKYLQEQSLDARTGTVYKR